MCGRQAWVGVSWACVLWAWLATDLSAAPATKSKGNSTMVTVPSDLLVQLLDVSRSLQKLLPADIPILLLDVSPEEVLARVNDEGPNSLLTLALRHHALLQQRNEDLLTQQGRCTAQIEAPQEDKQELRLHLQDCKKKLQYLQRGLTDILPPTDSAKPTDTTEDVKKGVKIDDLCPCRENLTEAQLEERNFVGLDCVCEKVTILPKTTPALVLLGTGSRWVCLCLSVCLHLYPFPIE
ncbi:uncharacterized protein LOC121860704 [Homarus americanus]|uniref:uncharacterized protein LOC121860704 n=1 Tax=Homarus americanus TaxID=6706 RepID=UPI001C45EF21|nr:uncharacterized protein LOC121860704 [Homarus americanus]